MRTVLKRVAADQLVAALHLYTQQSIGNINPFTNLFRCAPLDSKPNKLIEKLIITSFY